MPATTSEGLSSLTDSLVAAQPSTVSIQGVSKRFGANQALDDVGLDLVCGKIHALIGSNGSGKSTLIKILAGVQPADHGHIESGGRRVDLRHISPTGAWEAGFRFVHQADTTFPDMTVAENLALGYRWETGPGKLIREGRLRQRAREVLQRYGIDAHPAQTVRSLGPGNQALLAIARVLQDQQEGAASVLVLDEPTAALAAADVEMLLSALRQQADRGAAVVLVSHRLDEVLRVADTVTALRDGRVVATLDRAELTRDRLIELIAGHALTAPAGKAHNESERPVALQTERISGAEASDVSFCVGSGEIVGLTGLVGSGASTILRLVYGAIPTTSGSVRLDGADVARGSVRASVGRGMAFVPGDRSDGTFPHLTVRENLTASSIRKYWRFGRLRAGVERKESRQALGDYLVRASSPEQPITELSGGNQQKVVLARWLRDPDLRLLLLDEPTQGVDIGAKQELWGCVRRATDRGTAVIVASTDLEELVEVCDRVLVVCDGRVVEEITELPLTVEHLMARIQHAESEK